MDRLSEVAVDSLGIAFVIFAIGVSMATNFATKHDYSIDPNQVYDFYSILL